ncbi:hypothetical protein [Nonomuraea basaltis]|uniref:hypothetical protein n=1 Tax=Nonomuraea basaltis TaxID=2495887 RepID=UPI00110C6D8F|nr:hypothetical protein [Nonomuraea basaltis]TMS00187.1 hypothetical protein EJK15_03690 [Nonomuraea basaltis]
MIPARLLPLTVIKVRPATSTDRYGNTELDYGAAASRIAVAAWIDQASASEDTPNGRDVIVGVWKLITNHTDLDAADRIEWGSSIYELDGPAWPVHTPAGLHHLEARLRRVEG